MSARLTSGKFLAAMARLAALSLAVQLSLAYSSVLADEPSHSPDSFPVAPLTQSLLAQSFKRLKHGGQLSAEIYYLPIPENVISESHRSPYEVRSGARVLVDDAAEALKLAKILTGLVVLKPGRAWGEPTFEIVLKRKGRPVFDAIFTEPASAGEGKKGLASFAVVDDRVAEVSGEQVRELCEFMKPRLTPPGAYFPTC